jgi:hypothetical protein
VNHNLKKHLISGYLHVRVLDIDFAQEMKVDKKSVGIYYHLGSKLQDLQVLKDQTSIRIPLKKGSHEEAFVIKVQSFGDDE